MKRMNIGHSWPLTYLLTLFSFFLSPFSSVANTLLLDEKSLQSAFNQYQQNLKAIQQSLALERSELGEGLYQEKFIPKLSFSSALVSTHERSYTSPSGNYSPLIENKIALGQSLDYGLELKAAWMHTSTRLDGNRARTHYEQPALTAGLTADLYKNFLGKLDRLSTRSYNLATQVAQLKDEVSEHQNWMAFRKLYWQMVSNQIAQEVTRGLLQLSIQQQQAVQDRVKSSVADRGELAKAQSQVGVRKTSLITLQHQQETAIKQLQSELTSLAGTSLQLRSVNIDQTIQAVMGCVAVIKRESAIPFAQSSYQDLLKLLEEKFTSDYQIADRYALPDLTLDYTYGRKSWSSSWGEAYHDTLLEERSAHRFLLSLTLPLGELKRKNALRKVNLEKLGYQYESEDLKAKIVVNHTYILKSIDYLLSAIEEQKQTTMALRIRVDSMREKYHQGRVSIFELIADQDNLLNAELAIVRTKLLVIETLLDYLAIFNKTNCPFNY